MEIVNQKYNCKIDYSSWMRSHESAWLSITSPTGKSITIYKAKIFLNENINMKLIHKICDSKEILLTKEEMEELLEISKIQYTNGKR